MSLYHSKCNISYKAITIALVCLFCANTVILADPDTLAPIAGNPKVYQEMRNMMEERFTAHQDPIDEFIKQNAVKARGLRAIPYLEEEFMHCIGSRAANNMFARLQTTLTFAGGKIQVILVKSPDELPVFEGKKVWGHAGAYVTVFALESEKNSKEGRRKIIARLFHEIRARSTRAKELFDEEFKNVTPSAPEEISAFIRAAQERFEEVNLQIQQEVEKSNRITSSALAEEFADLTFVVHPHVMNRDYMMAKISHKPEEPTNSGRADIEMIDNVIGGIKAHLARVAKGEVIRKYANEDIKRLLLGLRRGNKLYFSPKQVDRMSRIIKLSEKLETLRLLFLYQNDGVFVFDGTNVALILHGSRKGEEIKALAGTLRSLGITEGTHLALILRGSRKEAEIRALVSTLKGLGITKGAHLAPILRGSRKEAEIRALVSTLKGLGITEGTNIALILASSRKEAEIRALVSTLKGLGITKGTHLALILASSRKEAEIKAIVSTLKGLGITKGAHLAPILRGSRKEAEIKALVSTLKGLGITEGAHLASILTSSRKEKEIEVLIGTLKSLGITEGTHLALILTSSRKEKEIEVLIGTLKSLGITEGAHLAPILHGSRKEADIKALVRTLKSLGITEGAHLAPILRGSRKETEIRALVSTLKGLGITEDYHLAPILANSIKEEDIKALVSTLKGLGITKGTHLALILASSRKEKDVKTLVGTLKSLDITEGTHIALILTSSRKEAEIKVLAGTLKSLGITKGAHLAPILRGSRQEEEIKALVSTLKGLGITEGTHLALILRGSRKEAEIKALVSTLKGLGITESTHFALILTSSRKEAEIKALIGTLKSLGITEGYHFALILTSSRKEKDIKALIGTLRSLGITEGAHLAPILHGSRKEEEIKALVSTLKGLGITEGAHLAPILHGSRKEEEIKALVSTLKGLGITEGAHLALILASSRKEAEMLSYINAFMMLKKKIPDFDIPSLLMARMIINPEFITRNFSYMLKEKAGLSPLDRLLSDEEKGYLRFRLLLRQFRSDTVYGLVDIFAEDPVKREELKECIRERAKEENARLSLLLEVKIFSMDDYTKAGLLLFSCDENIRVGIIDGLVERHFDRVTRYRDEDKQSLAAELLLDVSTRHNIYHNLLADNLKHSSYVAYLESYLKFIDLILYYRNQPESLWQIKKEFKKFKAQFEIEHYGELPEDELITEFIKNGRYDSGAVLLALGKVRVRSLDKKMGQDATLMDFISAPPIEPDYPVDEQLFLEEEQGYEESPDESDMLVGAWSAKREKPALGSIEGVFRYLCDNNIIESSGGITGRTIADKAGRSYATIDYDLRGLLYHLKLIQKLEEGGQKAGKDARYYVPEAVRKKNAEILPILGQFRGKDLRPNTALLDQIYEEKIKPILEPTVAGSTGAEESLRALPQEWQGNDLKAAEFLVELSRLLQIENVIEQGKSTLIFSEKVTFDNGLGVLLPKLAKSGIRVTVIATNDRQRRLIDELNQGKPENERIVYADTIADIRTKVHSARYYYFKVLGDPDTDLQGVTTFDITGIVKKIIDALGKVCGIVERERLELLHEAARKFGEAA